MTRTTDLVEVVLKHGKTTVEARRVVRAFAESTGRAMANQYEEILAVEYIVNEIASVKRARPHRSAAVPHHFQIVT
jgi:hypothetical protein